MNTKLLLLHPKTSLPIGTGQQRLTSRPLAPLLQTRDGCGATTHFTQRYLSLEQPSPWSLRPLLPPSPGHTLFRRHRRFRVATRVVAVAAGDSRPRRRRRASFHHRVFVASGDSSVGRSVGLVCWCKTWQGGLGGKSGILCGKDTYHSLCEI